MKPTMPTELIPSLIGLEGRRVETSNGGAPHRFTVGRSIGENPIHLEIHTFSSYPVMPFKTIQVL
jgi:hypothetical protein